MGRFGGEDRRACQRRAARTGVRLVDGRHTITVSEALLLACSGCEINAHVGWSSAAGMDEMSNRCAAYLFLQRALACHIEQRPELGAQLQLVERVEAVSGVARRGAMGQRAELEAGLVERDREAAARFGNGGPAVGRRRPRRRRGASTARARRGGVRRGSVAAEGARGEHRARSPSPRLTGNVRARGRAP